MWFKQQEKLLWFTAQFHLLYVSGIGFSQALNMLEQTTPDKSLQHVIVGLQHIIAQGKSLSVGLMRYPKFFPAFYIEMVKVGEETGKLIDVLDTLYHFYLRKQQLQQDLIRALSYPAIVMTLMLLLTLGMCFMVVPRFAIIFANFHTPLPFITRILFESVHLLSDYWVVFFAVLLVIIFSMRYLVKKYLSRLKQSPWILQIPLLGKFYQQVLLLQLCQVLALALQAGLSLQESFKLSERMFQCTPFSLIISFMLYDLKQGRKLSEIFAREQYFPIILPSFLKIAEETGTLDKQFTALADIFMVQVEKTLTRAKTLLEPCLMLVAGVMVGGICLAIYYPIFSLGSAI